MIRLPRALATIGLLSALAAPLAGQAPRGDELPVRTVVLENGMRFLILPRAGAPTVSFVAQYDVGGVNEHVGTTGIAHLLEHLLFKGTTSIGTRDAAAEAAWLDRIDATADSLLAASAPGRADSAALLPGSTVERVLAIGESQSAFRLTTYVNDIDADAQVYDAFLVHARGGPDAPLDDDSPALTFDRPPVPFRGDLRVPVLCVEAETDLIVLGSHTIEPGNAARGWGTTSYKVGLLCRCPVLLVK